MKNLSPIMVMVVRWTGWPLFFLIATFILTGYGITGRYGLGSFISENEALTLHRLFHLPLIVLWLTHSIGAIYLAMVRWRWIKP